MLLMLLVGIGCFLGCMAVIVLLSGGALAQYFKSRRQAELSRLTGFHRRLKDVVDGLLAQADEVDQASKFIGATEYMKLAFRIERSCNHLIILSEAQSHIERLLKHSDAKAAEAALLKSCRAAWQVSQELIAIRRASTMAIASGKKEIEEPTPEP